MAKLNGTNLLVYVGSNAIGGTRSCTLNISQDTPDATTKDSSGWKEVIEGLREWSIDFDGLYDPTHTEGLEERIDAIIDRDGAVTVKVSTEESGDTYWTGSAVMSSATLEAPMEDVTSYSGTLVGTGALAKATVSS